MHVYRTKQGCTVRSVTVEEHEYIELSCEAPKPPSGLALLPDPGPTDPYCSGTYRALRMPK
jgi:hypothetical protein